ncbi:hypothetical protein PYJP_00070 [Pyrofollis japonicus]|uniref:hypothetical protein n=1 Tax=Pyrofollis japonicus TaxID=3060460 RepID=UPI00295B4493|nr:hypothetical protein [Pyrofollis japonicus]BEP16655.1 hypothetical protein PYJP_00070 [Pyrofollis japonicus]
MVSTDSSEFRRAFSGGSWLLLSNITVSLIGLLFWLAMPRLIGLKAMGEASEIVSSAMLASTLVAAGLPLAVIRETAEFGAVGYAASFLVGLLLAILGFLAAYLLAVVLGYAGYALIPASMAFLSIAGIPLLQGLVGLEKYSIYFRLALSAGLVKLVIGIGLGLLGYGLLAALIGHLAYPATLFATGLVIALISLKLQNYIKHSHRFVNRVLGLTVSNYPQAVSLQLMSVLSVYLFAYIVGKPVNTGALYISLMTVNALAFIPGALTTAALPVSVESGKEDVIAEQLRIGLGFVTPIVSAFVAAPRFVLAIVKPELADIAWDSFLVMLLSVIPLSVVQAAVNVLNKRIDKKGLLVIGLLRLLVLILALVTLAPRLELLGAAIAFLAANVAALPLSLHVLGTRHSLLLTSWGIQALSLPLAIIAPTSAGAQLLVLVSAFIVSALLVAVTRLLSFSEALRLVRLFARSVLYKP